MADLYVAETSSYKEMHDKTGFMKPLQMTAEELDFLFPFATSLAPSLAVDSFHIFSMLDIWQAMGIYCGDSCLAS